MAPKLYSIPASPPVRAVYMCANVIGLDLELVEVNLLEKEHLKDDFLQKNPQHTVPVLEEEDGFTVIDSHAINAYLVAQYSKDDSLYPKNNPRLKAAIDHMLHFDSSVLFIRGLYLSKPLLFRSILPTEEKLEELREAFKILDTRLGKTKSQYIAGDILTIADFSIITSVTSWDVFVPYADFPNLQAYVARMQKLPCYEANKEGLATYKKIMNDAMNRLKA